jgi:hypothetical protein
MRLTDHQKARVEAAKRLIRNGALVNVSWSSEVEDALTAADEQLRALIVRIHAEVIEDNDPVVDSHHIEIVQMYLRQLSEYVLPEETQK